jgi:septal ring factor EnvC (AmiA/AmiB activator)
LAEPALESNDAPQVIEGFDRVLAGVEREERDARRELDALERDDKSCHARLVARGRAYVRAARVGLAPMGAGLAAFVDHATRLEKLRRALARDLELSRKISERRIATGKRLDELRVRRGPLEAQQQAIAQSQAALLAAEDRARAFEQAFLGGSSGSGPHTTVYGGGVGPTDPADLARGFAATRGRLPFPLPGRTLIRSARRGSDGPGLEMGAPRGTPVRAVFAGRIAFADEFAPYGKTVIVDHGEAFYTVSANLDEIAVRVGDEIDAGSRVGTVGDMGRGPMLYFEIRASTETLDPAEWFGI